MKIKFVGKIAFENGHFEIPILIPNGNNTKMAWIKLNELIDINNPEPTRPPGLDLNEYSYWGPWIYKDTSIWVDGGEEISLDELKLRIKYRVLSHDKKLKRMRREIEALERIENIDVSRRERIPESVRLYVWQRDKGRCVKCGSKEKLEFDHIIPVVKGGGNTERNIQLLCERCNRSKGSSI